MTVLCRDSNRVDWKEEIGIELPHRFCSDATSVPYLHG